MYNDSDSFYFSLTGDVTNSLQRQMTAGKAKRGADNNGSSDSARLSIEKASFYWDEELYFLVLENYLRYLIHRVRWFDT